MPNPIESLATKVAGKVGAVAAMTKGLKGVFVILAEQHKEAATLLARAASAEEPEKRRDLWGEIKKQLVSHERAELAEIYPAIQSHPGTSYIVQQHADEATELEQKIGEIDALSFQAADWQRQIQSLASLVTKHAAEEEEQFFPRALEALGEEGAERLEKPFLSAKEREMRSIH